LNQEKKQQRKHLWLNIKAHNQVVDKRPIAIGV